MDQTFALASLQFNHLYFGFFTSQNLFSSKMISHLAFPMVLPDYPTNRLDRCDVNQASFSQGPWHTDASNGQHHHGDNQIADIMPDPNQQFSPHGFDWDVTDQIVTHTAASAPPAAVPGAASTRKKRPLVSRPDSPKSRPSAATKRPSGSRKTLTPLPDDFVPSNYSVMCGQGNEYFHAIGTFQNVLWFCLPISSWKRQLTSILT